MPKPLVLASGSLTRQHLLRSAGLIFDPVTPRIDETALRAAMERDGIRPRDMADALAEAKARKISAKQPGALVIGSDQILALQDDIFSKPETPGAARAQLQRLRGREHRLYSAAVICEEGAPVWRHCGTVSLQMRSFSDGYLEGYMARNWPGIAGSVGAYKLEEEGVRLFSRIDGDYFTVLGLPMLELLTYLTQRREIDG